MIRSRSLRYGAWLAWVGLALVACSDESMLPMLPMLPMMPLADTAQSDARVDLDAVLERLDVHLAAQGAVLRPPIEAAELARLAPALPCALPPLLERVYRWHDGVDSIIPGYALLPLDQVMQRYRQILALDLRIGMPADASWPRTYLPILEFDSQEYIALDCAASGGALFHNMNEDSDWDARYRGLGHFLQVTLSAYESGAYRVRRGHLDANPIGLAQAYRDHALPSELQGYEHNWRQLEPGLARGRAGAFRMAIVWAQHFPDPRQVAVLAGRLADPDPDVVASAAFMLGQSRAQAAEPALVQLLDHPVAKVRNLAASALAKLERIDLQGDTEEKLIELLGDSDDLVRISAIEALAAAGSKAAVAPLLKLLPRSRSGIQVHLVIALGELRDPGALPALHSLRATVSAQDQHQPDRGGTRGADVPPQRLLYFIDAALRQIEP